MNKSLNTVSLEDMSATIFGSTGRSSYGFEAEDLSPEESAVIDGTDDETPEDVDVDDIPTEDDEQSEAVADLDGDAEKLESEQRSEEAYAAFGEARVMETLLTFANANQWSEEAAGGVWENVKANLKKFWEWLKSLFTKIKEGLINTYRKVSIWMAGDLKKYSKFANSLTAEQTKKIAESEVKMKVMTRNNSKDLIQSFSYTKAEIKNCVDQLTKGEYFTEAEIAKNKAICEKNKAAVKDGYSTSEQTAKKYFGNAANVKKSIAGVEELKAVYDIARDSIKSVQTSIQMAAAKAAKAEADSKDEDKKENIKSIKDTASNLQQMVSTNAYLCNEVMHKEIACASQAIRFALKALSDKTPAAKK